jgi:hypothetical protein
MLVCTTGFTGGFRAAGEETRPHHHALRAQRNRSRNPAPVHHPASREERRGEEREGEERPAAAKRVGRLRQQRDLSPRAGSGCGGGRGGRLGGVGGKAQGVWAAGRALSAISNAAATLPACLTES